MLFQPNPTNKFMAAQQPPTSPMMDGLPMPQRMWSMIAIACGVALSALDIVIANVALPTICKDLHISSADSIWIINAYQFVIVISLLLFAAIGDVIGHHKIFISGLIVFIFASIACSLSFSLPTLVIARIIQGIGASAITAVGTSLMRFTYPKSELSKGMAVRAMVVSLASAAGPSIAAGILLVAEWHWLFAINIPFGVMALILSIKFLPRSQKSKSLRTINWSDAFLNALLFGLFIGIIEAVSHDYETHFVFGGSCLFLLLLFYFVKREKKHENPILPVDLFKIPLFSLSILSSILTFLGQMLGLVATPFFLQQNCGLTEVKTGVLMSITPVAIILISPLASRLIQKHIHIGLLGAIGLLTMAIGTFGVGHLSAQSTALEMSLPLLLIGIGFGVFITPNNSLIMLSAPNARSGAASGVLATSRILGQTIGASLMAYLFHQFVHTATYLAFPIAAIFIGLGVCVSLIRLRFKLEK